MLLDLTTIIQRPDEIYSLTCSTRCIYPHVHSMLLLGVIHGWNSEFRNSSWKSDTNWPKMPPDLATIIHHWYELSYWMSSTRYSHPRLHSTHLPGDIHGWNSEFRNLSQILTQVAPRSHQISLQLSSVHMNYGIWRPLQDSPITSSIACVCGKLFMLRTNFFGILMKF